jgi:nitrate reductase molybdenum cofactor assembly chaperone
VTEIYDTLTRLFEYPTEPPTPALAAACCQAPESVRRELEAFLREAAGLPLAVLQERYIQAFDMNPDCCLDIGWHLFGEEYARGEFLVRLKGELHRYGLPDSTELPDHLTRVLPLLARMPLEEAGPFRERFLLPALDKLEPKAAELTPYNRLLAALRRLLEASQPGALSATEVLYSHD